MEIINGKKYYSPQEIDTMIKNSIKKNAKDLAREIKNKKIKSKVVEYV